MCKVSSCDLYLIAVFYLLQLACYDQAKQLVLNTGVMSDNIFTHFLASSIAVSLFLFFDGRYRIACFFSLSRTLYVLSLQSLSLI